MGKMPFCEIFRTFVSALLSAFYRRLFVVNSRMHRKHPLFATCFTLTSVWWGSEIESHDTKIMRYANNVVRKSKKLQKHLHN